MYKKTNMFKVMEEYNEMRKNGVPEKEIAEHFGMTTVELRIRRSCSYAGERNVYRKLVEALKKEGKSNREIALIIGKQESSVRALADDDFWRKFVEA